MKALFTLIILFSCNCVWAQTKEVDSKTLASVKFDADSRTIKFEALEKQKISIDDIAEQEFRKLHKPFIFAAESPRKKEKLTFLKTESEADVEEKKLEKENYSKQFDLFEKNPADTAIRSEERFHWKPALIQSGTFLGIQHGFRLFQAKTQRELGGPFFRDWANSVKNLRGWRDGDNVFINYVGHPMQGAATGRIFINNSEKSRKLTYSMSKDYWTSRMKAMAWSAVWSTQFELGPVSEATIGNVGVHDFTGRSRMAFVDLVMTPTAGTGVLISEDMIDRYILKNWLEKKLTSRTRIKVYRTFFTPLTSFINVLGGKKPWKRYNR